MSDSDTAAGIEEQPNIMNHTSAPHTRWSRVNVVESFPGVAKPLAWDFFGEGANRTWRAMFSAFGLIADGEPMPAGGDTGYLSLFFGRPATNIDRTFGAMSLFQGGNASDHASALFSESAVAGAAATDRAPRKINLAKFEQYTRDVLGIVAREHEELRVWWRNQVAPETVADKPGSARRFLDARRRYESAQTNHSANSTLCQQVFSAAMRLAEEVGKPGLAPKLTTGFGDTFDTRSMLELWRVSRREITLATYLETYGFQCSFGDDISVESWRENPRSLMSLVETYAKMDQASSPLTREHERAEERRLAEKEILGALPEERRAAAQALFDDLQESTRIRELGKASYRMAIDGGRAAARARGQELHELGVIDDPSDVFFLTQAEGIEGPIVDFRQTVGERKEIYDRYVSYDVPVAWTGTPRATIPATAERDDKPIKGIGASAGVTEGRVCLVLDHATADDMEPGEILVTNTTDPSWGPFFVAAGALVIDIGGQMSHGAIIARELGIPCVINTQDGSRRLKTGDWVRVDGGVGEVTLLEPAHA